MCENPIGIVADKHYDGTDIAKVKKRLKKPSSHKYFNTGVILFDAEKFRERNYCTLARGPYSKCFARKAVLSLQIASKHTIIFKFEKGSIVNL